MDDARKIKETFSGELRRGTLVLAVLSQLHQPAYGYTLGSKLGERGLNVEQNTLYPLLRRLEGQGLLESFWELEEGRQRRYYRLSPFGRDVLLELEEQWRETKRMLDLLLEKEA